MTLVIVDRYKKKLLSGRRRALGGMIKYPLRQWMVDTATSQGLQIASREALLNEQKYQVFPFGSEESIIVSEPYNSSDELPSSITSRAGTFAYDKPFVCEIANAELVGPTAVGFDEDGNLISETVTPSKKASRKRIPVRALLSKKLPGFKVTELDSACSLVNCCRGYYHWLLDCLTRIEGLEHYQERTGRKPILIIDSNPPKWKRESLKLLGYQPDDCLQWNRSRIQVKQLVVPSFRTGQLLASPSACRWLRQRMCSNLLDVGSKKLSFSPRIYISRARTAGRNVINEDEVLKALTPLGFVAYTLEKMSFPDQVKLFSQAEIVVAPHGAGLANIIFAQNLIVIELFGASINSIYFRLAKTLGFEYGCLISGKNESKQHSKKYSGIKVDVLKLRELVKEIL